MHNIFGTRFVGMRSPAWHALGTVLPDDQQVTAREALSIGGIDFLYHSVPVGYRTPDGEFVEDPARTAILREPTPDDPTWRPLGFASSDYTFLQNADLADGLDALATKTGWTFETVGALGSGERVFLTLKASPRSVFGDEYKQYFIVTDGKVAGKALQIFLAPVRVVCQNTVMAAESRATSMVKLAHVPSIADDYSFWTNLHAGLEKSREQVFLVLEHLASRPTTADEARRIIAAAYPDPSRNARAHQHDAIAADDSLDPDVKAAALDALSSGVESYESRLERQKNYRAAAYDLYVAFSDGHEQNGSMNPKTRARVAGTAYAALQAVTELADWSGSGAGPVAAASALFGSRSRVKTRAWRAATALLSNAGIEISQPAEERELELVPA